MAIDITEEIAEILDDSLEVVPSKLSHKGISVVMKSITGLVVDYQEEENINYLISIRRY